MSYLALVIIIAFSILEVRLNYDKTDDRCGNTVIIVHEQGEGCIKIKMIRWHQSPTGSKYSSCQQNDQMQGLEFSVFIHILSKAEHRRSQPLHIPENSYKYHTNNGKFITISLKINVVVDLQHDIILTQLLQAKHY